MADGANEKRTRPTRPEVRRRILDAARDVFAARGIDAASLDEVAARAGLTKGAIYSNFAGKDALIYALMDREVRAREDLAGTAALGSSDAARAVGAAMWEAQGEQAEWQRLFLEFWLRAQRDPDILVEFAERRRAVRASLARRLAAELDAQGLRSPFSSEELAIAVLALSNGLALERLTEPESVPADLLGRLLQRLLD